MTTERRWWITSFFVLCLCIFIRFKYHDWYDLGDVALIPYAPLGRSNDSVRILELLPGHRSHPIQCKLAPATLSASPPYEALSYQWGDATKLKAIYVDDVKTAVTENLWHALKSLRDPKIT